MRSMRAQLLIGLAGGTLLCMLVGGLSMLHAVGEEANEQADLQLKLVSDVLPEHMAPVSPQAVADDGKERVLVQLWDAKGAPTYSSYPAQALALHALGYSTVTEGGARWRVFGEARAGRRIQVAQLSAVRDGYASELERRLLLPLLVLLVLLAALFYAVVGRVLRPIERLARTVAQRSAHELLPLDDAALPPELEPIVAALNSLLGKIDQAMAAQRNFVADAAHELRSPLAALKLQLQLAERGATEHDRMAAVGKLHERLDRATRLVEQLLTMARQESDQAPAMAPVDLHALAQQAVADHVDYAEIKAIDLGVDSASAAVIVEGNADGLAIVLGNLVSNALRYGDAGVRVDVLAGRHADGRSYLQVRDTGKGVPEHLRARLTDRFYRPDGNAVWGAGLGLAIVKGIADQHGAQLEFDANGEDTGLVVTLTFR